jgi:hypothetical protein
MRARVWRTLLFCLLPALAALGPRAAHADPLMLNQSNPGDVTTFYTAVTYTLNADPLTGTLTATGLPIFLDSTYPINGGFFDLSAVINRATGALVSGALEIDGSISGPPDFSSPLLTGTLTEFGFPSASNFGNGSPFEFVFNVSGGSLAPVYYTSGEGGIIMDNMFAPGALDSAAPFTAAFQNDGTSGFSDTFPLPGTPLFTTPQPSSFVLMGVGLASLMSLMWWRHGSAARLI